LLPVTARRRIPLRLVFAVAVVTVAVVLLALALLISETVPPL
jgi:hypothetical protein